MSSSDIDWEVEAILAWHDEDARAAIATLLSDIRRMRKTLIDRTDRLPCSRQPALFATGLDVLLASAGSHLLFEALS